MSKKNHKVRNNFIGLTISYVLLGTGIAIEQNASTIQTSNPDLLVNFTMFALIVGGIAVWVFIIRLIINLISFIIRKIRGAE